MKFDAYINMILKRETQLIFYKLSENGQLYNFEKASRDRERMVVRFISTCACNTLYQYNVASSIPVPDVVYMHARD